MGQYYKLCNVDTKAVLCPHDHGDGAKLMEFGSSGFGTMTALASLLVLNKTHRSPWAAQRIVAAGDYADEGRFLPLEQAEHNLYMVASGYAPDASKASAGANGSDDEDEPCLPAYDNAKKLAEQQLAALGYPELLRESAAGVTGFKTVLSEPARVFDQPEDVLEALEVAPSQDGKACVGRLMTECRVQGIGTPYAWGYVYRSHWETSADGKNIVAWHVQYVSRERGATPSTVRTLRFPATAQQVADWLGIGAKAFL